MRKYIVIMLVLMLSSISMGLTKYRLLTVWNTSSVIKLDNNKNIGGGTEPIVDAKDTTKVIAWYSLESQVRRWNDARKWIDADNDSLKYYANRKAECLRDTVVMTPEDVLRALEVWGYRRSVSDIGIDAVRER